MSQAPTPDPPPGIKPTDQMTFADRFFGASQIFSDQILKEVPELQGIAIVPSWHILQEHLPFGLVSCLAGPPSTPAQLYRQIEALLGTANTQFNNLRQLLEQHNQLMSQMAEEIRVKNQELKQINDDIIKADQVLIGKEEQIRGESGTPD